MVSALLVFAQLHTPPSIPACAPSRTITRAVRAYCDRTDGDWRADYGCEELWAALRTCDPALTITRRRERIELFLDKVASWTMELQRTENAWRVSRYEWVDCCECPADPWRDRRLDAEAR